VLQIVELGRGCFACMLGGADGQTLCMVAAEWDGPTDMGIGIWTFNVLPQNYIEFMAY